MISQPSYSVELTDIERSMVYRMEILENSQQIETKNGTFVRTRVGINAGGSMVNAMVALIARNKQEWPDDERYIDSRMVSHAKGLILSESSTEHDRLPCSLVVTHPDMLATWSCALESAGLKFTATKKLNILEKIILDDQDVIVVTPSLFNTCVNFGTNRAWKRLIIDPTDIIIPNMAKPVAGFYWILSENPGCLVARGNLNTNRLIKEIIGKDPNVEQNFCGLILRP